MKFILLLMIAAIGNVLTIKNTVTEIIDPNTGDIVVIVDEIEIEEGSIYVGLFNSKSTFRKIEQVYKYEKVEASSGQVEVVIEDVPFDDYAVVIFQDFNGNEEFDKNFVGVPKEPFGFSTNFQVSTKAPKYDQVTFNHQENKTELEIDLQTF